MVRQGELCGFIVATRQDVPWAYMTPIIPILKDIKRNLGVKDIRLPAKNELRYLATSPKEITNESSPSRSVKGPSTHPHPSPNTSTQEELSNVQRLVKNPEDPQLNKSLESMEQSKAGFTSRRSSRSDHTVGHVTVPLTSGVTPDEEILDGAASEIKSEKFTSLFSMRWDKPSALKWSGLRLNLQANASVVEDIPREKDFIIETSIRLRSR